MTLNIPHSYGRKFLIIDSDQYSRRQMGALGLDVETALAQHVVVAHALDACESIGVVHQVANGR